MRQNIPAPILALTAEIAAYRETHATLDSLFTYSGASGDPPEGSKHAKALEWLRRTNKDAQNDPLRVLGKLLEGYMELEMPELGWSADKAFLELRHRLTRTLAECQLQYVRGGRIAGAHGTPSRSLEQFIRELDFEAINQEFLRAISNAEASPREAVSAASNILESVCKVIIAEDQLAPPQKQDLQSVWGVVRKHLGIDPSKVEDQDLQQILTGLYSVIHGIGSLRTHASSAHGAGTRSYKLAGRHARLAVHSAHTLALFILESWRTHDES